MNKEETLEEASIVNCKSITHPYCDREKEMFIKGAKWQAERMYTEEQLAYFAGYCAGAKMTDPSKPVTEILEEWKEKSIFSKRKES